MYIIYLYFHSDQFESTSDHLTLSTLDGLGDTAVPGAGNDKGFRRGARRGIVKVRLHSPE